MSFNDLTMREALLIRRTAWANSNDREATPPRTQKDIDDNWTAVRMITMLGCLNYAMLDLGEALVEENKFKQLTKKNFNRASALVEAMHTELFGLVSSENSLAGRCYNDVVDKCWSQIEENVCLEGVERPYNIILSLCRLIQKYNAQIRTRYAYRPVDAISHILDLLSVIGAKDYHLDICVDKSVVVKNEE